MIKIILVLVASLSSMGVVAGTYKCVDEETGSITFTDTGCKTKQQEDAVKSPEDYTTKLAANEQHFTFPTYQKKYSTVSGSSRCDKVRREIQSISDEINTLQGASKTLDGYVTAKNQRHLRQLRGNISLLESQCP